MHPAYFLRKENMCIKYLYALDLSLNSTGVCIFSIDGNFIKAETIDTHSLKKTQEKLKMIGDKFNYLIKEYEPQVIVIEKGFTRYNTSTQALFRVHGLANYIFCEYEQIYYASSSIKKAITGKGNSNKKEVRNAILKNNPSLVFKSDDESDAYALALVHFMEIKKGNSNA